MTIVSKNAVTSDLDRAQLAFVIKLVKRNYGLKLSVKEGRFYISKRFQRLSVTKEKRIVSRDLRLGACLYFAKTHAQANKLGIYKKGH